MILSLSNSSFKSVNSCLDNLSFILSIFYTYLYVKHSSFISSLNDSSSFFFSLYQIIYCNNKDVYGATNYDNHDICIDIFLSKDELRSS